MVFFKTIITRIYVYIYIFIYISIIINLNGKHYFCEIRLGFVFYYNNPREDLCELIILLFIDSEFISKKCVRVMIFIFLIFGLFNSLTL